MKSMFFDLVPATGDLALALLLFFPDQNFAVVGARREDMAIFRMRPCDLPDRSGVSGHARIVLFV